MRSFYVTDGASRFLSTRSTAGPWGPDSQHGGPPAALLTRAVESVEREAADRVVGRFTMELLAPVPVGPLRTGVSVVRPGRSVEMCEATAYDASGVSSALDTDHWRFPNTELTVHVLRPPVGEWVCLDAETSLSSGRVGLATSRVYDERGLMARSAQALLLDRR